MRYLFTLVFILAFNFIYSQDSVNPTLDPSISEFFTPVDEAGLDYDQKAAILNLIDETRLATRKKMKKARHLEGFSKVIMQRGYDFAKAYNKIKNQEDVPFSSITSASAYLSCWSENNYKKPEACWNEHMYKLDHMLYDDLNN